MKTVAWILGLIGMLLVIDGILSIGFGEKYVSFVLDYAPIEYVTFVHDVTHSPTETLLVVRLGEIFMGYILILLSQKME